MKEKYYCEYDVENRSGGHLTIYLLLFMSKLRYDAL